MKNTTISRLPDTTPNPRTPSESTERDRFNHFLDATLIPAPLQNQHNDIYLLARVDFGVNFGRSAEVDQNTD